MRTICEGLASHSNKSLSNVSNKSTAMFLYSAIFVAILFVDKSLVVVALYHACGSVGCDGGSSLF